MMRSTDALFVFSLVVTCGISTSVESANFVGADHEVLSVAEASRRKSAIFWTGKVLPGDWSTACPITILPAQHAGGGTTSFRIEAGEVFDWSMTIEGRRDRLLEDVIPHEVDHMVRASLVRRPIERWLDEGCATLFESERVKQELRTVASRVDAALIQSNWLASLTYPIDSTDVGHLYAVGFSLTEFLLTQRDPRTLLELQSDAGRIESRLMKHYQLTIPQLREQWDQWRIVNFRKETALRCNCQDQRPLLLIWTASWCRGCQLFWQVWRSEPAFRHRLEAAFHIHVLDYDQHQALAAAKGVTQLPTFQLNERLLTGFVDATQLLQELLQSKPEIPPGTTFDDVVAEEPEPAELERDSPASSATVPDHPQPDLNQIETVASSKASQSSWGQAMRERLQRWLPLGLTTLQWTGIVGGSVATGGVAGLLISLLPKLLALRRERRQLALPQPAPAPERRELPLAPFPRELDEARQLLELRQTEGRVAVLDAIRGMFLDDEIEKLMATASPERLEMLSALREAIDRRVDKVAPLTVDVESDLSTT